MAGQALIVNEVNMASSNSKVSTAAPLANHPKIRSAIGPERAFFMGGGLATARGSSEVAILDGKSPCAAVVDMAMFSRRVLKFC
jgi:hypothetical protein